MSFEKICKKVFEDTSNKGMKVFEKYNKKQLMICCVINYSMLHPRFSLTISKSWLESLGNCNPLK
jgi:hypothetical protein